MERIITAIISMSSEGKFEELQKFLQKEEEYLHKQLQSIEQILGVLDFEMQSLGALHLLWYWASHNKCTSKDAVILLSNFICACDPKQISLDPKKFAFLCSRFLHGCRDRKQAIRAIKPLEIALIKVTHRHPGHISPQHSHYVLACILAKAYKQALPLLERDDYKISPEKTGVRGEDVRTFLYYGAICYTSQKNWRKAITWFQSLFFAPAQIPSAIMIEAYKKYSLVSLIVHGEVLPFPKGTSSSVMRYCEQLCGPYKEVANAFLTRSVEDVYRVVEKYPEVFIQDSNIGLVKQATQALQQQNIIRMNKTFSTIGLDTLAQKSGVRPEKVKEEILRMIESGRLQAVIDEQNGYVAFKESDSFNGNETLNLLCSSINNTVAMHKKIVVVEREIELSEKWQFKALAADRQGGQREEKYQLMEDIAMELDEAGAISGYF